LSESGLEALSSFVKTKKVSDLFSCFHISIFYIQDSTLQGILKVFNCLGTFVICSPNIDKETQLKCIFFRENAKEFAFHFVEQEENIRGTTSIGGTHTTHTHTHLHKVISLFSQLSRKHLAPACFTGVHECSAVLVNLNTLVRYDVTVLTSYML
jgi:hypothetical protein